MSKIYARLIANVVVELIEIPDEADIADRFTPELVATMRLANGSVRQGWTWDGSVFAAPVTPDPTADQQLSVKIQAGITITATNTDLNGTYALDADSQANITGVIALLGAGQVMPQDPLPYPDMVGAPHAFDPTEFKAFASAISGYVFALRTSWASLSHGGPANWPTLPVDIGP